MCQQWLSVAGLLFDVVGFLLIAVEWHHMFKRDVYMRQKRIERDYNKSVAEEKGEHFNEDDDLEYTMWREFQRLLQKDTLYRKWLFGVGVSLVVSGFVLQLLGNWPYGVFGIKSC
jgi:hypothetical protein